MGLIRKALFLQTGGLVSPNSKKQQLAKQQIRLQKQMLKTMQQPVAANVPQARTPPTSAAAEPADVRRPAADVILTAPGAGKIQVIKIVRAVSGCGLKEAKALVDSAPSIIMAHLDRTKAEQLKRELEAVGARIELRPRAVLESETAPCILTEAGSSSAESASVAGELERLGDLHHRGVLTDDEFAVAKTKVLGS